MPTYEQIGAAKPTSAGTSGERRGDWVYNAGRGDWLYNPGADYTLASPETQAREQYLYGSYGTGGGGSSPSTSAPQGYSVSAYFGGKDTEAYRKYQEGKKAGKWKDLPDYQAKQASGEFFIEDLMEANKKRIEEESSWVDKYLSDNPFVFDEQLARESATAEYEPYYNELLDDYLNNINLKRQTIQDDRQFSNSLQQLQDEQSAIAYSRAISRANEGFSGKGLFSSGMRESGLGNLEVDQTINQETSDLRYNKYETDRQRSEQGIDLSESEKRRDIGRDTQTAIEGGILTRESEAIKPYRYNLRSAFQRNFGNAGDITSYMPYEFEKY
jgi:hypothetical protein